MAMKDTAPDKKGDDAVLIKVLTSHFQALVTAKSDNAVLKRYSALLRFLKSQPSGFLEGYVRVKHRANEPLLLPGLSEEDLQNLTLDDLEKIVNDDTTPRRYLERIAIRRFSVPTGSMRSFSNRQSLIDKLSTLIDNERTHQTIGTIARGETKQSHNTPEPPPTGKLD
jgi:hypothetical protein